MQVEHWEVYKRQDSKLTFGYLLARDADLLILRRPGYSFVAAFGTMGVDPFEVEATLWEDAD
jgi:hypothetical protein